MNLIILLIGLILTALFFRHKLIKVGLGHPLASCVGIVISFSLMVIISGFSVFMGPSFTLFLAIWSGFSIIFIIAIIKGIFLKSFAFSLQKADVYFLVILLIATYYFTHVPIRWGTWDAVAIWNLHAKFLFYEGSWTNIFSNSIAWTHADYPLFLPSLISTLWHAVGNITPLVPIIITNITLMGILSIVYYALIEKRQMVTGLVALLILLADGALIRVTASQIADSLLALFFLISMILFINSKHKKPIYFLYFGFVGACCLWIKNEGAPYFMMITLFVILQQFKYKKKLLYYVFGTLPILLIYFYFKIYYGTQSEFFNGQKNLYLGNLFELDRYILILNISLFNLINFFRAIFLIMVFTAIAIPRKLVSFPFLILYGTILMYFGIYIITPYDLQWHLDRSIYRLIFQFYPVLLFLGIYYLSHRFKLVKNTTDL